MSQFERLDELVERVAAGDLDCTGALSTGERLYVALAANSVELLARCDYTIAEALARLGDEWVTQLSSAGAIAAIRKGGAECGCSAMIADIGRPVIR